MGGDLAESRCWPEDDSVRDQIITPAQVSTSGISAAALQLDLDTWLQDRAVWWVRATGGLGRTVREV